MGGSILFFFEKKRKEVWNLKLHLRKYFTKLKIGQLLIQATTCKFLSILLDDNCIFAVFFCIFFAASAPHPQDGEILKDWVFINYTFKRFEGLTQRGTPTKKWAKLLLIKKFLLFFIFSETKRERERKKENKLIS